ncbi:MAG TPA: serine hydrolase, partial [Hanamia sp.]|nr:serine hydrolase [Hanamia sp.]
MKYFILLFFFFINAQLLFAQTKIPSYYTQQKSFTDSLKNIIVQCGLDSAFDAGEDGMEKISFAVIDLMGKKPVLGGVNMDNFIYPASVYKMYVAMEILKQVNEDKYSLYKAYVVKSPNDVDHSSEISWDPRS